jgi:hypothetical protein
MAPLRASVDGHFGPELRRFALAYIVRDKSRRWPLVKLLRGIGILISKRQVVARVLIAGKQGFVEEAPALLWGRLTGAARVAGIKARSQPKKGMIRLLAAFCGMGLEATTWLVREVFIRPFRRPARDRCVRRPDRRAVPERDMECERGISKTALGAVSANSALSRCSSPTLAGSGPTRTRSWRWRLRGNCWSRSSVNCRQA